MSNVEENLAPVVFVNALTFTGLLVISLAHTLTPIQQKTTIKYYREFTSFYILVWLTLVSSIILYFWVAFKFAFESENFTLYFATFYFIPTELMLICYALLYYQLELMMTASKLETGTDYLQRFKKVKCAKCVRIFVFVLIGVFVAV